MITRILIVEDEQILAEDLAAQVRRMRHEVVGIAISGEEAISMAAETRPDLVLMDIQLDGQMTGIESARSIQKSTGARIVFVTAYPGQLLGEEARAGIVEICVNKPYSRLQLEAAIQKAAAL